MFEKTKEYFANLGYGFLKVVFSTSFVSGNRKLEVAFSSLGFLFSNIFINSIVTPVGGGYFTITVNGVLLAVPFMVTMYTMIHYFWPWVGKRISARRLARKF
ncbi:hypothetical protein [Schleiferilactobacillus perolens]|uniref:hypothetical protein n=1 Tax=Schleiferilactobacillus perolens TaxID=100468 RepID=UPI00070FAAC9|nr:hypothetical protein [Schleiferilactobacillus perolens]